MKSATMKSQLIALAKAMMKGARKHPRNTGDFFSWRTNEKGKPEVAKTCALGAAWVGSFGTPTLGNSNSNRLFEKYPVLNALIRTDGDTSYSSEIANMNDGKSRNRYQIAQWLMREAEKV